MCFKRICITSAFKITKEIKQADSKNPTSLAIFDTSKYKEIRIGVLLVSGTPEQYGSIVEIKAIEDDAPFGIFIGQTSLIDSKGKPVSNTVLISSPPTKIEIFAPVVGTYKVYIWGQ